MLKNEEKSTNSCILLEYKMRSNKEEKKEEHTPGSYGSRYQGKNFASIGPILLFTLGLFCCLHQVGLVAYVRLVLLHTLGWSC